MTQLKQSNSKLSGLLYRFWGALSSGNRAAYVSMAIKGLSPLTRFMDAVLVKKASTSDNLNGKIIFIVSPPRSGSTVLFQTLTRALPSIYLSNYHALMPRYASVYMKRKGLYGKKLYDFKNYYGYTPKLNDVYEGNEFIDSLFKDDPDVKELRRRVLLLAGNMRIDNMNPLIIKNVRNFDKVLDLYEAVPEMIFLRIKRNPEQIIQSELRAYYELGTFHPIPQNMLNETINDPLDFAVRQIAEIERQLDVQINHVKPGNVLSWEYEKFCAATLDHIEELAKLVYAETEVIRHEALKMKLKASSRPKVSDEEETRIRNLAKQLFP